MLEIISKVTNTFYLSFMHRPQVITPEGIFFSEGNQSNDTEVSNNRKPQAQPGWDHEEQALLVVEYFYYKNSVEGTKKSNQFISYLLRKRGEKLGIAVDSRYRNLRGIETQRENLSHFDPEYKGKITGHESKWMRDIMDEYLTNTESIKREAYEMIKKYSWTGRNVLSELDVELRN